MYIMKIINEQLSTEIKSSCDVLVAGGGFAGIASALAAARNGADVLITGDMKYHDAQDALDLGMNVIDCGHFDTEDIFKDAIGAYLKNIEEIEVIKSKINLNPFKII